MGNAVYPFYKAWKANGTAPASSYLLYTYESGTTNPKTTYSDNALTTPNANPIVLNANGEASIFLGSGAYRFDLKTPAGALVNTFQPIQGSGVTMDTVQNIAELKTLSSQGLTLITVLGYYTPSDGGGGQFWFDATSSAVDDGGSVISPTSAPALGRWKRLFSPSSVNVKWFGAKGDSATNDYTSISKANTYVQALTNGGDLFFPNSSGSYFVGTNLVFGTKVRVARENGARITSTGLTVTFNAPVDLGETQFFSSTVGLVTFTANTLIRPEWWGATRDGTTDDTVAFTAAMLSASNRTLLLSAGTYKLTTWVMQTLTTKLIIIGDGIEDTTILGPDYTTTIFVYTHDQIDFRDLKISTFRKVVYGQPAAGSTTPVDLISFDRVNFYNCGFACNLVGSNGENDNSGVKDLLFTNCLFTEMHAYAIEVFYKRIDNCLIDGCRFVDFSGTGSVVGVMFGYDVINIGDTGAPGHANRKSVRVINNHFEELNSTGTAIEVQAVIIHEADEAIVSHNTIKGLSNAHATAEDCEAIYIRSVRKAIVQGNIISKIKAGEACIDVKEFCSGAEIIDNFIDNTDYATLYNNNGILCFIHNCKISGNKITNIGGMGVNLVDYITTDAAYITDNIIENFGAWCGIFALCSSWSVISRNRIRYAGNLYQDNKNYGDLGIDVILQAGGYTNFVAGDIGKTLSCGTATGVIRAYNNTNRMIHVVLLTGTTFSGAITTIAGTGAGTFSSQINLSPCGIYVLSPTELKKYWNISNNTIHVDETYAIANTAGIRIVVGFEESVISGNSISGVKTAIYADKLNGCVISGNRGTMTVAGLVADAGTIGTYLYPFEVIDLQFGQGWLRFPSTQVPSAGVNDLDDYQEKNTSFTPGLKFGGSAVGITYTTQAGSYTKIGRQVFFNFQIQLSNKGAQVGAAVITGLPLASSATSNACFVCGYYTGLATIVSFPMLFMDNGATTLNLYNSGAAGVAALTDANFTNASRIYVSGSYFV